MMELAAALMVAVLAVLAYNGVKIMPLLLALTLAYILLKRFEILDKLGSFGPVPGGKTHISEICFDCIGGQAEAKQELMEALDLLQKSHANSLGVRALGGIMLQGPPGTGKTLMARAAANYTDSVFVSAAGSEFIEMYAGVGAKRVRELFAKARRLARRQKKASAVIFIDELDVVGAKRGKVESHMEYDQTLNQLLVELDGIEDQQDVSLFVLGATNRIDLLDEALLRPGRFDRIVEMNLPDYEGRLEILKIHAADKPLAPDVDLGEIAQQTFGFSGAHLANLVNEAAIQAMRRDDDCLRQRDFLDSIDKVQLGTAREGLLSSEEKYRVAVHECGHALISETYFPGSVSTVTVVPRSKTLGFIRQKETSSPVLQTESYLHKQLGVLLAGGTAEQLILGERSTGAANDYQRAVELSELIISHGLSRLGIVNIRNLDKDVLTKVTGEIISERGKEVEQILEQQRSALLAGADVLMRQERISGEEFRKLMCN
ncbi:MAG: AAA family ATPase [Firmicutes bacterium]|nr:AAA family ATPase [Bacillota bacterium]